MFVVLDQADGQLKPYGCPGREVLVFQERDVLLLVDGLSPELECASPPVGDRRVRRGRIHRDGRPLGQEDRRRRVMPAEAAVGEAGRRGPDGLADGEVDVVRRHSDVSPRHPDLQQPWVGVNERGASEAAHHECGEGMPQVEQQVGLGGRVEVERELGQVTRQGFVVQREQRDGLRQAVWLQAALEGRHLLSAVVLGIAGVDPFQPDHPTAQRPQAQGPLEIHPQVPATLGIREGPGRREANRGAHDPRFAVVRSAA